MSGLFALSKWQITDKYLIYFLIHMKKIKCVFFVISLMLIGVMASAQATDSVKTKSGFFSKVNLSKIQMPKLHLPKGNLFKKDTTVKKDTAVAIQNKKEKTKLVEKPIEVNPWTLSGTTTYNTLGNVGIGTSTPATKLDVSGDVSITGKINLTDPSGTVATKITAYVDAGTFVNLDNIKASVTTSGSRGLSLATVSGSFTAFINGTYATYNGNMAGLGTSAAISTTATSSIFGWNFIGQGDTAIYIINDSTNKKVYRITLMIGGSYLNNLIIIERLL